MNCERCEQLCGESNPDHKCWNTAELQQDFNVSAFAAPWVIVIRKSDGVKGSLEFTHQPRWYFNFIPA